jgi:ATP-dependent Clp protease adaptor protein ClpS
MPVGTLPAVHPGRRETTTTSPDNSTRFSPLYKVVLLDDDSHTYQYVVEMLVSILGCPPSWAFQMAVEVDFTGRVIVDITTLEEAQILQEKIHAYGADWRMPDCQGSMTAIIEPED